VIGISLNNQVVHTAPHKAHPFNTSPPQDLNNLQTSFHQPISTPSQHFTTPQSQYHSTNFHPKPSAANLLRSKANFKDVEEEKKDIITLKAPLDKNLRDQNHLAIYRQMVDKVHRITTAAYLLARYIFVRSYEGVEDPPNQNPPEFNADVDMTSTLFSECLYSLQSRPRAVARAEQTIRNRSLIKKHLNTFCQRYIYQPIAIEVISSNWEAYVGGQMHTEYINNT
jgi:hypothetical protein